MNKLKSILSLILIASILTSCASSANLSSNPYLKDKWNENLSRSDMNEIQSGEKIHREIMNSFSLYTERQVNIYVNQVSKNIAQHSQRPHLPYVCTVLTSDKIYATGAPGGYIYITTGFINYLDNEAELAGVLAHEIAHLQYRNPKYSTSKKTLEVVEVIVGVAGGVFGPIGMLAFVGVAALNVLTDEKGLDKRVLIADKRALEFMQKAGYDPQGLVDVLYKLIYSEPQLVPYMMDYYRSRPVSADRMLNIGKVFDGLEFQNVTYNTHREKYLTMMSSVKQLYTADRF